MERERLTRLLQEPGLVARTDLAGLTALAEKYPWFSSAHLLRAAGERQAGELLFDETLRTTSAHLPSRAALFDLVHVPPVHRVPQPDRPVLQDTVRVVDVPAPPATTAGDLVPEPPPVAIPPLEERDPAPVSEPERESALDLQIMEAALASAYDLTWTEQAAVPEAQQSDKAPPPIDPQPLPPPEIDARSRLKFTAWLEAAVPVASAPPPTISPGDLPTDVQDWLREPGKAVANVPPNGPASRKEANALIDRFIQQGTPEPSAKASFYSPQKAAKKSLEDTAGMVTETLARIYEKQGNLSKAIDTYRRLALKYPEKGAYFAALQKALEDQSNA